MDLELGNHVNPGLRNHLILELGNHVNFFTALLGNHLIADNQAKIIENCRIKAKKAINYEKLQ